MKTEPHPRHHDEDEPPPPSLIHHEEPTLLEQWLRRALERGPAFWGAVAVIVGGLVAIVVIAARVGGPGTAGTEAWTELASVASTPPSALSPFGPEPEAGLPERLREIAREHPGTAAGRWAELRAATMLLNEGSAELSTTRREAGAGKIVEADELFRTVFESAEDESLRRMAALGRARAAEARLGIDADDTDHAKFDDVLALYDEVVESFPDTPEADEAANLRRRLRREDSRAFYEQLARYNPNATLPGSSSPSGAGSGLTLPSGGSSSLQDLLNLPALGSPSAGGPGLDLTPPSDLSSPSDPAGMPSPVALPTEPAPSAAPTGPGVDIGTVPVVPAPEPAGTPAPESPQVPDDPFGSGSTAPPDSPAPAAEPPAGGGGGLPDSVFPTGGPNG